MISRISMIREYIIYIFYHMHEILANIRNIFVQELLRVTYSRAQCAAHVWDTFTPAVPLRNMHTSSFAVSAAVLLKLVTMSHSWNIHILSESTVSGWWQSLAFFDCHINPCTSIPYSSILSHVCATGLPLRRRRFRFRNAASWSYA